jgi:hypothetical protein
MTIFVIFLTSKHITTWLTVSLREWNPVQLLISKWLWTYKLDFRPWSWDALNKGLVDNATFKNGKGNFFLLLLTLSKVGIAFLLGLELFFPKLHKDYGL